MTGEQIHRRTLELTESRAALERRLGELSDENERLRLARDRLLEEHKNEREKRQDLEVLLREAADVIGRMKAANEALPENWRLQGWIHLQAATWEELAAKHGVTRTQ